MADLFSIVTQALAGTLLGVLVYLAFLLRRAGRSARTGDRTIAESTAAGGALVLERPSVRGAEVLIPIAPSLTVATIAFFAVFSVALQPSIVILGPSILIGIGLAHWQYARGRRGGPPVARPVTLVLTAGVLLAAGGWPAVIPALADALAGGFGPDSRVPIAAPSPAVPTTSLPVPTPSDRPTPAASPSPSASPTPSPTTLFTVTLAPAGTGTGRVISAPAGIDCPGLCTGTFPVGTRVVLTARPAADSVFAGWSACEGLGTCTALTTSAVRVDFVVPTLTVTVNTPRAGVVSDSTERISCPPRCTASYAPGATVTLTASPGSAALFSGWSGGCSGVGPCTLFMTAPRAAGANFAFKTAPGFDAALCQTPVTLTMHAGDPPQSVVACFTNTGSNAWVSGTPSQVSLGQCCPLGQASPLSSWGVNWPSATTYANQGQTFVTPGQLGFFPYSFRVPIGTPPGIYVLDGDLVLTSSGAPLHPGEYSQTVVVIP